MNAEIAALAPAGRDAVLPVPEAVQAVRSALDRVRMSQRRYAEVRRRASPAAVARVRTDWGLAVLEWIEASVALAAAEDGRGPGRAASEGHSRRITVEAGPARGAVESAWRRYQQARRDGAPDQAAVARAHWRAALVDWFQALAQQRATEDLQHAQQRRAQEQVPGPGPQAAGHQEHGRQAPERPEHEPEQQAAVPEQQAAGPALEAAGGPRPAGAPAAGAPPAPDARAAPPAPDRRPGGRARPAPRRGPPRAQPLGLGWTPARRPPGS
jgi:hypothetical protein